VSEGRTEAEHKDTIAYCVSRRIKALLPLGTEEIQIPSDPLQTIKKFDVFDNIQREIDAIY
jgi:hypothetical protein